MSQETEHRVGFTEERGTVHCILPSGGMMPEIPSFPDNGKIEAMSCGKPVVATRIPGSGVAWVNQEGVSGLNVPPRDASALADAIRKVADERDRYGAGARRLFEERYRFDRMIDRIQEVYASISE